MLWDLMRTHGTWGLPMSHGCDACCFHSRISAPIASVKLFSYLFSGRFLLFEKCHGNFLVATYTSSCTPFFRGSPGASIPLTVWVPCLHTHLYLSRHCHLGPCLGWAVQPSLPWWCHNKKCNWSERISQVNEVLHFVSRCRGRWG